MKYEFEGIGQASASGMMLALAAYPPTAFLTMGFVGKITFFLLTKLFMVAANYGLIFMNVGAAKIETIITQNNFDQGWDDAENLIKKIRDTGRDVTPEEAEAIDQPVIDAFRKFANFGRVRPSSDPRF